MMKTLKIVLTSILTLAVLIGGDESRIGTSVVVTRFWFLLAQEVLQWQGLNVFTLVD